MLTINKSFDLETIKLHFNFLIAKSTKPKTNKRSLNSEDKQTIVDLFTKSNYSYQRITNHLKQQGYDMTIFTIGKIRKILKDNQDKKRKTKTVTGERRNLYDYAGIEAFRYLQYDTKKITDQHALPKDIYDKFKSNPKLPIYQWTIIDVKTRTRFLAWSRRINSTFGLQFLIYVITWLRAHGITQDISIQCDMGCEFYSDSKAKQEIWNTRLKELKAFIYDTEGQKWKQNIIERSHRIDDEWFYCPRGKFIDTKDSFLAEAQNWIIFYNNRSHYGIGMNGLSPKEKLLSLGYYNADQICNFPCLILEDFFVTLQELISESYAQNVLTLYHNNGTKGYDVDIVDRDYKDGTVYRESKPVYRDHTVGMDRPKDHDDSQAVKEYQEHESSGDREGNGGSGK